MLTLLLPVRDWPADRIRYCIRSFQDLGSDALTEILVIDFGSAEPLPIAWEDLQTVRHVRLEAEVWSLAEAINAGVVLASNDIIAKTDADIIIDPRSRSGFDEAAAEVASGELAMAVTQAIDVHQSMGPQSTYDAVVNGEAITSLVRPKWGQGGLVMFSRQAWSHVGGFDSRFTGWGNEDNDFAERIRNSGQRLAWTDREHLKIYHVWHPPTYAATGVISQRLRNQKIAHNDKSIFRRTVFQHSNFTDVAGPSIRSKVDPLVTLAIATTARDDRERMVTEAIESFRGQLDNDFEIVVADNGSEDDGYAALEAALSTIRWPLSLRLERLHAGSIPAARNKISELARGKYICVVDDDDIALPNRLHDHLKVFEKNGSLHGSHGGWIDFDETTGLIERNSGKQRSIATLLRGTGKITAHPASLYRTDVLRAVPYDESFALGSDFDLALRMANLGLEIGHTGTYLTLRRYHSSNVTITGQANQVSNGAAARARTLESFPPGALPALSEIAKEIDAPVYCRNQMSLDAIAKLLPPYVGTWRLVVPSRALASPANRLTDSTAGLVRETEESDGPGASQTVDASLLEGLVDLLPGDLATLRPGLDQEIVFVSEPIEGVETALELRAKAENYLQALVELIAERQHQLNREKPFAWNTLGVQSGERRLRSIRFQYLAEALVCLGQIGKGSLLAQMMSIVSDFDESGECYYAVSKPLRGLDKVRQLQFELERRTGEQFKQIAANGVESELVPSGRTN